MQLFDYYISRLMLCLVVVILIVGILCRKKRKWDQPVELLVSTRFAVPFSNVGTFSGMPLLGVAPVPSTFLSNPLAVSGTAVTPIFQQQAALVVSRQNQVWKLRWWLLHKENLSSPNIYMRNNNDYSNSFFCILWICLKKCHLQIYISLGVFCSLIR